MYNELLNTTQLTANMYIASRIGKHVVNKQTQNKQTINFHIVIT